MRKLFDYDLISRQEYPDKVLRVKYSLIVTRRKLAAMIGQLRDLDETHASRKPAQWDSASAAARKA